MINDDLEAIKREIKNKRKVKRTTFKIPGFIYRTLTIIVITLITLIGLKSNSKFRSIFYKKVYETNISFASINNMYQKAFGSPIPFKNLFKDNTKPVFSEKIVYKSKEAYLDGVKLTVESNYLVSNLETGLVVFIGEKENYGNTVIVEQVNGLDVWYSNMKQINVKLYDYIEKGSLLGEVKDDYLYMVFKKDGEIVNYEGNI